MPVAQSLAASPVLDGKYALLRELGSGPSGTVYEAEHLAVGKLVAVKLLHRESYATPQQRDQFLTDARTAARIAHPNVVDIHDLGVTPDGVPYLVTELLHGQMLAELIATRGALAPEYACEQSSAPLPFVAAQRQLKLQETLTPHRSPPEFSVIPIRVASYARGVSDSLLVAPRFPRSANSPRLEVGRDFMPRQGEPGWAELEERRVSTQAPQVQPVGRNAWPALIATGLGFGLGVAIAWLSGAI